jgi:hypothetical protein
MFALSGLGKQCVVMNGTCTPFVVKLSLSTIASTNTSMMKLERAPSLFTCRDLHNHGALEDE